MDVSQKLLIFAPKILLTIHTNNLKLIIMKKLLRFSLLALFAVFSSAAMAGSIVFADLGLENGVQYSDPFDGGDFTVTFAGGGNDGKYYTTGAGIRVYGGGTMTISAKSGTLKKIVITYDGTNKPTTADVVDGGTYDPSTGTWTGDAATVVFTRPTGSGHWRVKKIEVGDDASSDVPTEGQTAETAITVDRALEIIDALEDGKSTDYTYYVKGTVSEVQQVTSTGATFMLGDLKCYRLKGLENKDIVNTEFLKANDVVVVYGSLQKYIDKNNNNAIVPEVSSGYVYSVNGKTQDDSENPEDAITTGKNADSPMTAQQALAYISEFPDGFITSNQYYVSGTVSEVTEINTEKGNATFKIGDLVVYRVKGLENKNITDENYLAVGDEVVVLAKLQKYGSNETATPELSSGYVYKLNGKTKDEDTPDPEQYTFVGDGSKTNPYTAEDVRHMNSENYPADNVWVKGVIVGSASSATKLNEADKDVDSNIAIADNANIETFIPVQLTANTAFRTKLNVKDNPSNVGKDVLLYGQVTSYFSATGVKNLVEAEFDGETITGNKAKAELSWGVESKDVSLDADDNIFPQLSNPHELSVTYSSSKEEVATIDENGVITLKAVGQTKISAIFAGNDTYEASTVSYTLNVTSGESVDPEAAIEGGTTAETALTVDQALAYIEAFPEAGFTTTKQYYVKGTVSEVTEISTKNGNATFKMGDLVVFRVKGLQGNSITDENYLKEGDEVVVLAKLQKYVKNETTTPELSSGYIYELNGKTTDSDEPVEFAGDGTKENPYTVADLKQMKESDYPTDAVWVIGVIVGSAKSATELNEEDKNSNIAIADEITRSDAVEFVPVELKNNTDFRAKLNVVDNPGNIGMGVMLCGKIEKYFGTTGIKSLVEAEIGGETITGIQNLTIGNDANAPIYNLKGERVDQNYRGVVIQNGHKKVQK